MAQTQQLTFGTLGRMANNLGNLMKLSQVSLACSSGARGK